MHKIYTIALSALLLSLTNNSASARLKWPGEGTVTTIPAPVHHFYMGGGFDGAIFSTAIMKRPQPYGNSMGTLRFSLFFNTGVTFNYDLNKHVGLYTGVDIKNVGFIEKGNGFTVKHRTYNVGVPLGIKFGNLNSRNYFFAGAGADVPFNYKEKAFETRSKKEKFSEWFSDRTPAFMGYVFAGMSVHPGLTIKVQYYLTNFLNDSYTEGTAFTIVRPYAGYDVHLLLLSLGFNMHYSHPHHKHQKAQVKTSMAD